MKKAEECWLVAGMHRSGTSALAGALQILGVDFGARLMAPRSGENDRGFFEDLVVYEIHRKLFCVAGGRWDDLWGPGVGRLRDGLAGELGEELATWLEERLGWGRPWGVKDPRLCRLLPLWLEMLEERGVEPRLLLVYRHPAEVADSLGRRDGFTPEKSGLLWAEHNLSAELYSRGRFRAAVAFEDLLVDPVGVLRGVEESLELRWPRSVADAEEELRDFLDPGLRHHRAVPRGPESYFGRVDSLVKRLYRALGKVRWETFSQAGDWYDALRTELHAVMARIDPFAGEHAVELAEETSGTLPAIGRAWVSPGMLVEKGFWVQLDKQVEANRAFQRRLGSQARVNEKLQTQLGRQVEMNLALQEQLGRQLEVNRGFQEQLGRQLEVNRGFQEQIEKLMDGHGLLRQRLQGEAETSQALREQLRRERERVKSLENKEEELAGLVAAAAEEGAELRRWLGLVERQGKETNHQLCGITGLLQERTLWLQLQGERLDGHGQEILRHQQGLREQNWWLRSVATQLADHAARLAKVEYRARFLGQIRHRVGLIAPGQARWLVGFLRGFRDRFRGIPRGGGGRRGPPEGGKSIKRRGIGGHQRQAVLEEVISAAMSTGAFCLAAVKLEACSEPRVTVLIPVYNQIDLTLRCLESIASAPTKVPFEVLIVDDASTDETFGVLSEIENLRIVRCPENLGFLRAVNLGSCSAQGEYLVLLNNDTRVTGGWLDGLVQSFSELPRAGLVGAMLLGGDGRVQESGGLVWRDGTAWNYGRDRDPGDPEIGYAREVDYCSAACIMVPYQLFVDVGRFDERYAPAYYEDTDLAFKIREAGYKVYVQPEVRVHHEEGATCGTDPARGSKKYQERNRHRFLERWQERLRRHRPSGAAPELEKERAVRRRILVLDHRLPTPDQDAGSVRMTAIFRALRELGFKVTFLPLNLWRHEPYCSELQRVGVEVLYAPFVTSVNDFLQRSGPLYDAVFISRLSTARDVFHQVRRSCKNAKLFFDTVDLHFLRETRRSELEGDEKLAAEAMETMRRELEIAGLADATLVVSPVEKALLLEADPNLEVHILSNIHSPRKPGAAFGARKDLLFIGGFEHPPNLDGVCWFAREILPLVARELPQIVLHLVGSRATEEVRALGSERVRVWGFVPDVDPFFAECRLSVAPLRYGAGVKGKVGHSLALGLPCVATTVAAEGMDLAHERELLIADDPAGFAAAVVRLYRDEELWCRLSEAGMKVIERSFSPGVAKARLKEILGDLVPESPALKKKPTPKAGENHVSTQPLAHRGEGWLQSAASLAEYRRFREANAPLLQRRRTLERELTVEGHPFFVTGHCFVCQAAADFAVDWTYSHEIDGRPRPNWREHLICPSCHLNNRTRAAIHLANRLAKPLRETAIYLTEQVTPLYRWYASNYRRVQGSEYLGTQVPRGTCSLRGIRNEDLRNLTFSSSRFDLVLCLDVLEHVSDYRRALEELLRVTAPGGSLLLSVPFDLGRRDHLVRAVEEEDGTLRHLLDPEYHGNPLSDEGSLVYRHFGWDLLDEMREIGFQEVAAWFPWSREYGYLQTYPIFLGKKALPIQAGRSHG